MSLKVFIITSLTMAALVTYFFVSAPPPLSSTTVTGSMIPIERVFEIVESENDTIRMVWTKEIVGEGKKQGLKFSEEWREANVEAGPLPALFLRETAKNLERQPIRLSLFLGSEFPINDANQFEGLQTDKFQVIKSNNQPQFFFSEDTQLYTAMFSDIASVDTCVDCHNEHKQSPKNDWQLNQIMGATTWMFPKKEVSVNEFIEILNGLRTAFRGAYDAYLKKVSGFQQPPEIGTKWPRDGYFLPSTDSFMRVVDTANSVSTLQALTVELLKQTAKSDE